MARHLISTIAFCAAMQGQSPVLPQELALGRQTGPFRFTILSDKLAFQPGETIALKSILRNEADHSISLFATDRVSFYGMDVRLPGPEYLPFRNMAVLSPEGERLAYPGHSSATNHVLRPGMALIDNFELNRLYAMTAPGDYHVIFFFRAPDYVGKNVTVMSNELVITVEEKK
jgi:hypothetical protein